MLEILKLEFNQINIITRMMRDFYAVDNYPIDPGETHKLFEEFILDKQLGISYLIYFDKEIIGYAILTFVFSFEYKGRIAFMDELYIAEFHRGKGIGSETIKFLKNQCYKLKLKLIYLEVENHNLNAQKLYIAEGFKIHNRTIMKYIVK